VFYEVTRPGISSARIPKQNPSGRVTGIVRDNTRGKIDAHALMYATATLPRALHLFTNKIALNPSSL